MPTYGGIRIKQNTKEHSSGRIEIFLHRRPENLGWKGATKMANIWKNPPNIDF